MAKGHKVGGKLNLLTYFLVHFSAEWDYIWCGDEAIQVEHPDTTFEWNLCNQAKQLLFYSLCPKILNVGLCSDVYEPVWFELDVMKDTIELSFLILVHMTFTLIQG